MSLQSLELTLIYQINQIILNPEDENEFKLHFINNLININHESYKRRLINIIEEINNISLENDEFKNNLKKELLNYKKDISTNSSKAFEDIPLSLVKENSIITFKFENSNLEEDQTFINNDTEKLITEINNKSKIKYPSFSADKKKEIENKKTFNDNKGYTQRLYTKDFLYKLKEKEPSIKKKKNLSSSVKQKSKITDSIPISRNKISGLLFPSSTYNNINSKVGQLNSYSNIFIGSKTEINNNCNNINKFKKKKIQKNNDNNSTYLKKPKI